MSNFGPFGSFELKSIVRGAQLTVVGTYRSLQNPALFTSQHYRQAAIAVAAGIAISLVVAIPSFLLKATVRFAGLFTDLEASKWDDDVIDGIHFIQHSVLQVPFFLMTLMRRISPAMDDMFMDSLKWVDHTYTRKHQTEDPTQLRALYYPSLAMYSKERTKAQKEKTKKGQIYVIALGMLQKFGRKAALSLAVYLLTFVPYVGRFVLPGVSCYTFYQAVGPQPAILALASTFLLPRRYLVHFLQSYYSSRNLMRELLDPYFSRIQFSREQKQAWFRDREGVLYGFAIAFFYLVKLPLIGVLVYGLAEASTAFLITKITTPPPPPGDVRADEFRQRDVRWENKRDFLKGQTFDGTETLAAVPSVPEVVSSASAAISSADQKSTASQTGYQQDQSTQYQQRPHFSQRHAPSPGAFE